MAAQAGDDVLIKVGDAASPEVFTTIGGIRSASISLNNEMVDTTSADDTSKQRQLLAAAGIQTFTISGSGVFKDSTAEGTIRTNAFAQTTDNYNFVIPDFGTVSGAFLITSWEMSGDHNAEVVFSLTFESAGDISWTAA